MLLGVSFQSGISSESLERVTDVVTYSEIHTRGPQAGPATLFRPALRHSVQQMFMLSDVYYNTIFSGWLQELCRAKVQSEIGFLLASLPVEHCFGGF